MIEFGKCCKSISNILNCPNANVGRGLPELRKGLLISFCKRCKRLCHLLFSSQANWFWVDGGVCDVPGNGKERAQWQGECTAFWRNFHFLITSGSPQPFQTINDSVDAPIGETLCMCICIFSLIGKCVAYLSHCQHKNWKLEIFILISCAWFSYLFSDFEKVI